MLSGLTETITNVESALLSPGQREMMLEHILRTQTSSPDSTQGVIARRYASPHELLARIPLLSGDLTRRSCVLPVSRQAQRGANYPGSVTNHNGRLDFATTPDVVTKHLGGFFAAHVPHDRDTGTF